MFYEMANKVGNWIRSLLNKFYRLALAVGGWVKSLSVDKTWHIIGNMILASIVATVGQLFWFDMSFLFIGVLLAGFVFEVQQYLKSGNLRLRDSLEDLVANAFGAGSVFLPLLIK